MAAAEPLVAGKRERAVKFSEQDKARVKEAVQRAESTTSGEIVPLIVHTSDSYPHADLVGAIVGQLLALIAGIWLLPFDYFYVVMAMLTGFIAGYFITRYTPFIKRAILGKKVVQTEVYQRALQAFFELGLANTRDRTGILIMVSLLERRVQVLCDKGINEKVAEGTWDQVVALVLKGIKQGSLIDGLCLAIERCGELLTTDFPIKSDDTDELDNELIVQSSDG